MEVPCSEYDDIQISGCEHLEGQEERHPLVVGVVHLDIAKETFVCTLNSLVNQSMMLRSACKKHYKISILL